MRWSGPISSPTGAWNSRRSRSPPVPRTGSLDGHAKLPIEVGAVNLKQAERSLIEATLQYFEGNKTQTAVALGCSLKTLYNKLNGYTRDTAFSH